MYYKCILLVFMHPTARRRNEAISAKSTTLACHSPSCSTFGHDVTKYDGVVEASVLVHAPSSQQWKAVTRCLWQRFLCQQMTLIRSLKPQTVLFRTNHHQETPQPLLLKQEAGRQISNGISTARPPKRTFLTTATKLANSAT